MWTPEELGIFFRSVAGSRWEPFWVLAANTGARRGELLGLRWRDVDLDATPPTIHINQAQVEIGRSLMFAEPKTAAGKRTVGISTDAAAVLRRLRDKRDSIRSQIGDWNEHDLVFCRSDGHPVRAHSVYNIWVAQVRRAGLPHMPLHGLRHTHISLLHQSGEPLRNVSLRVGHEDPSFTLRRYTHPDVEATAGMGQRFDDYLARCRDVRAPEVEE